MKLLAQDCIFCKIIRRDVPAKIVDETANVVAFVDMHPVAPTHILIAPKVHIASVSDLDETHQALIGEMVLLSQKLAKQRQIRESGYRLVINTGADAGQSVLHIHLHLLGGRSMQWPPG